MILYESEVSTLYRWVFLQSWLNGDYVLLADVNIENNSINRSIANPFVIAYKPDYCDGWQMDGDVWTFSNLMAALAFMFHIISEEAAESENSDNETY